MQSKPTYKYYAFISYNSHDINFGKKLQRKLEGYRIPATLCQEYGWERKPIKPIFFAPTDIQPGGLTNEIQERLKTSKYLIVICSPHSAQSKWVGKEIAFFHQLGRTNNIQFFIIDGIPHSKNKETECYNPIINTLGIPEILGVNIHDKIYKLPWLNKERAYIQLITKLLDIDFDTLWQRHKRRMVQKAIIWTIITIVFLTVQAFAWLYNRPINIDVQLNEISEHNPQLPPLKNAIISLTLENEIKTDTLESIRSIGFFPNIPHHFLSEKIQISFVCKDYIRLDTLLELSENIQLNIKRDTSVYGKIHFFLWNSNKGNYVPNSEIKIAGYQIRSDDNGLVSFNIPLNKQKSAYHISASFPLIDDTLYMPCGNYDIIEAK